jgi:hypothetical protein
MLRSLYGPIGISGTKIRVHGGCCHGKRWQIHWRVGQWQLMLVVVCFVFLCFVLCSSGPLATDVVEN